MDRATELAIDQYAAKHPEYEPALLKAVAWVESAGVVFWTVGGKQVPAIRFEGHWFYRLLKGDERKRAVAQGLASPAMGSVKNPRGWAARYQLFERACAINREAAIAATSWGFGQVMGFNYKALRLQRPSDIMDICMQGVEGQLEVMVRFIEANDLDEPLRKHEFKTFAAGYNGPAYKKFKYDTQIAAAYKRFSASNNSARAESLKLVQEQLAELGLYKGKIDGLFGAKTSNAIKAFQQAAGLSVDGKFSTITNEQLNSFIRNARNKKRKDLAPLVAVAGSVASASVPQVIEAIEQARDVTQQAQGLLTVLNFAPWVAGIILAILTGFVIYTLLYRNRINSEKVDALKIAKQLAVARNEGGVEVVDDLEEEVPA